MKTNSLVAAAITFAFVATVNPTTPVQAYPATCSSGMTPPAGGYAACLRGTGTFRVALLCKGASNSAVRTGPFLKPGPGQVSRATCPTGYTVQSVAVTKSP